MARYQLILAYEGTDFQGFQRQAQDSRTRTVQGVFESALRRIGWDTGSVLAAGRTDAGVHASGQVVVFDMEWKHSIDDLQSALNANLPDDVAVQSVGMVASDFHPRYDAQKRRYNYKIYCRPTRDPLRDRYAWRVWPEVDLDKMNQASAHLIGSHDFSAFGSPPHPQGTTTRHVHEAAWSYDQDGAGFDIVADAFLYHMVRRLVSMLVKVGHHQLMPDDVLTFISNRSLPYQGGMAPARGLTLVEVTYPN